MNEVVVPQDTLRTTDASEDHTVHLVSKLAELLPSQGPITAFAFLNPLQGMEHKPFIEVLREVNAIFGCEPFLQENAYRKKLVQGRILSNDLQEVLVEEPLATDHQKIAGLIHITDLRLSMLKHSINPGTENELRWELGGLDAIRRFRTEVTNDDREELIRSTRNWVTHNYRTSNQKLHGVTAEELAKTVQKSIMRFRLKPTIRQGTTLTFDEPAWETICLSLLWRIARTRMKSTPKPHRPQPSFARHRDLLLTVTSIDTDEWVHAVLGRFSAAYLDQGYAQWRLPGRELGFFASFLMLFGSGGHVSSKWLRPLKEEISRIQLRQLTAAQSLEESLSLLGITAESKELFLRSTLLAQRGWAGMIWQTEIRPDRVYIPSRPGSLIEYLAVRLILERLALSWVARTECGYSGPLSNLLSFLETKKPTPHTSDSNEQRAYPILQLAQLHGWSPQKLAELSSKHWGELVHATESFSAFERRRVFHLAFERKLVHQCLDAISIRSRLPISKPESPTLQVFTCIDAREESFRRHLEETAPDVETFGNAGFFNVPMYFRGAGEAHFSALCPIVIKPQAWVVEEVVLSLVDSERQRANARRWLGNASYRFSTGTRGSLSGAILTAVIGPLFTAPLVGRIIFPRLTAKMHRTARSLMATPPVTRLRLERPEGTPAGPHEDGIGFTLTEMVNMGERALRDVGLTTHFARLAIILGHGSNCLNNPHESAYHCGACSGAPGGANARALAAILNDRRVRAQLSNRGITIPEDTHFIGGLHNTATEAIQLYDLELLPTSHIRDLKRAMELFVRVGERNAHERCRRFETASLQFSPIDALHHTEDRSEDLAQTRPEYGNSTNALCFVGRRSRIRGLYLDRRSFLMSYDASQDTPTSTILARILAAVIPVCEGINMLYTLSAIDNRGWGAGTKLPHNITSLLGVMDGAASDLRTGLPWQGVDIHEPVRLLFVIESTADAILRIMDDNPTIGRICRNGWAQLAILAPDSHRIQQFVDGKFVDYQPLETTLPQSVSSCDWYQGHRDNLPFAMIYAKEAQT